MQPAKFPGIKNYHVVFPEGSTSSLVYSRGFDELQRLIGEALRAGFSEMPEGMFFKVNLAVEGEVEGDLDGPFRAYTNFGDPIVSMEDVPDFLSRADNLIGSEIAFMGGAGLQTSSLTFRRLIGARIGTSSFKPRLARAYVELPAVIKKKKACINVKNKDDRCFEYAVLSLLYTPSTHSDRPSMYSEHVGKTLDFTGITFPVKVSDIQKFERLNDISVNLYELSDEHAVLPARISREKKGQHVNILVHKEHYVGIKSMDRLINSGGGHQMFHCDRCLHGYKHKADLEEHYEHCLTTSAARTSLPSGDNALIKLNSEGKAQKKFNVPIYVVADFETQMVVNGAAPTDRLTKEYTHQAVSYCFHVVSSVTGSKVDGVTRSYVGEDAAEHFVRALDELYKELLPDHTQNESMKFGPKEKRKFAGETSCFACHQPLRGDKVRHHNHATGEYIAACHSVCNLKIKRRDNKIPIIFHNGTGYDFHLVLGAYANVGDTTETGVTAVPNNTENFKTVGLQGFKFIDSCSFLQASLDTLSSNLIGGDVDNAPRFKRFFGSRTSDLQRFSRKGVYPYRWATLDKFSDTQLPGIEAFYNDLTDTACKAEEYEQAKWVWDDFGCRTFRHYHDTYLYADVLLLADVFERFRELSFTQYQVDPLNFISLPSMAWAALIDMCRRSGRFHDVELLTDQDMYIFFERAIRGGVSQISTRHAVANNPLIPGYDSSKPTSYLSYLDANNLYGHSMMQYLPSHDFVWSDVSASEIMSGVWEAENGCFAEVDMVYPEHLHDLHNDLPLAPETINISADMASPHCSKLAELSGSRIVDGRKLAGHFGERKNYVADARALQFYANTAR